jgi:hypothetical protein
MGGVSTSPLPRPLNGVRSNAVAAPAATFEYVGQTALTVVGPITRQRYRFRGPNARLHVDRRDEPYLAGVANLRRVFAPR